MTIPIVSYFDLVRGLTACKDFRILKLQSFIRKIVNSQTQATVHTIVSYGQSRKAPAIFIIYGGKSVPYETRKSKAIIM